MTRVLKICGLTRAADVPLAQAAGATHLGVVLAPGSPRRATPEQARAVLDAASVPVVGVFRGQAVDDVRRQARELGLRWIQLHGGYTEADARALRADGFSLIVATPVAPDGTCDPIADVADVLLLDTRRADGTFGGAGQAFDWHATPRPDRTFWVAGGLGPHNVAEAIAALNPAGVDLSSGVEARPGLKDPALLEQLGEVWRSLHSVPHSHAPTP